MIFSFYFHSNSKTRIKYWEQVNNIKTETTKVYSMPIQIATELDLGAYHASFYYPRQKEIWIIYKSHSQSTHHYYQNPVGESAGEEQVINAHQNLVKKASHF